MTVGTQDKASREERPLAGLALASVSAIAFGTVAPLAKLGYDDGAGVFPLLAVRFATAALLLLLFHRLTRRSLRVGRAKALRLVALGGLGYAVEASLFFSALERAPAGVVTLVFYSYPLITTMLAFGLRLERFRLPTVAALMLGSAGVASIFSISGTSVSGLLLAVSSATAVALYLIAAGIVMKGVDPGAGATWTAAGAALATAAGWLVSGQDLPAAAVSTGLTLGAVTSVAFLALYGALVLIGPSRTSVAQMLEPVVTVAIAAHFLDERITFRIAIGTLLIVSALPVLASSGHERAVPPPPDTI